MNLTWKLYILQVQGACSWIPNILNPGHCLQCPHKAGGWNWQCLDKSAGQTPSSSSPLQRNARNRHSKYATIDSLSFFSVFISLYGNWDTPSTWDWGAKSSEGSAQWAFTANWATEKCRIISLPKGETSWPKRVSNPGPLGTGSYALPLRHTGSTRGARKYCERRRLSRPPPLTTGLSGPNRFLANYSRRWINNKFFIN